MKILYDDDIDGDGHGNNDGVYFTYCLHTAVRMTMSLFVRSFDVITSVIAIVSITGIWT